MGKLGKETKNLLLAITVICLISFLLAAGLSFLLAKDFQHEMLLHDYGVSGYQLNHEDMDSMWRKPCSRRWKNS